MAWPTPRFTDNGNGSWSWSLATTDNGSGTVVISAGDGEHKAATETFNWSAANVAPTATLGNDGPIDEGSSAKVSFSGQSDPSSADTTTGFHYAFACDNGDLSSADYASAGTDAFTTCSFADDGTYTVKGGGADIWGTADQFRFAWKRLTGDGWIIAKVESIGNTNAWAKAGVMIRGTLDAGSRFAYNIVSATSGVSFGQRLMTDGTCTSATTAALVAPYWVKLTRTGDVLKAETSADGKTWTIVGTDPALSSATVTMTGNLYIGLCVTSHNTNPRIVTTGVFSNISTSANVTGTWQMSEIGIDSPENSPQDLYVVLQDSANRSATVTWPGGSNAAVWTQWKIPLSQFTGVNMAAIKKMVLGAGSRTAPAADGAGRIFFDDIGFGRPTPQPAGQ